MINLDLERHKDCGECALNLTEREEKIWAAVPMMSGLRSGRQAPPRCILSFERGYLFITNPGRDIANIKPKEIVRRDSKTLRVNTGWNHLGWFTIIFDTSEDADKVELQLQKILPAKKSIP